LRIDMPRPMLLRAAIAIMCMSVVTSARAATQPEPSRTPPVEMSIFFSPAESPEYVVLVEKEPQRLSLFKYDGTLSEVFRMPCSTGENQGPKVRSGDAKTPEGVYFFIKEHKKRDLAPIYGTRAFPIDYPNVMDTLVGRNGNAIWLHGTNKPLKPRDSNGCIVLRNKDIDRLAQFITLNRTPMIIVDTISQKPVVPGRRTRTEILDFVEAWIGAIESGTYHDYLSFYDAEYLPDLHWWMDWYRLRKEFRQKQMSFSIKTDDISVFQYNGMVTVLLDRHLSSPGGTTNTGTVKLFLGRRDGRFRIVGEDHQVLPSKMAVQKEDHPLVAAGRKLKPSVIEETEIVGMVDGWLSAWSGKNIKAYGSYYAIDFKSEGGANRDAWLAYKQQLNRKYRYIRVTRDKMTIRKDKNRRTVRFIQTYRSSRFKAVGVKELILKREENQWKIYREIWKKK